MEGGGLAVDRQQCREGPLATAEAWASYGWVKLKTVRSTENVADQLTKPKSKVEIEELLKKVGAKFEE